MAPMRASSNLTALILSRASNHPDSACLKVIQDDASRTIAWGEFRDVVCDLVAGFDTLNLRPGDAIGIRARSRWEWLAVDLAAMGRGLVVVPIDPAWSERRTIRILSHVKVRCLCIDNVETARQMLDQKPEMPHLQSVVLMDPHRGGEFRSVDDVAAAGAALRRSQPSLVSERLAIVAPDAVATIIHTGGSTGEPRGVVRTHRNLVSRGWAFFPWEGNLNDPPPSDELLFQPLSLCHSAGRWWCHLALAGGRTLALPSTGMETLSLDELQRLSPTHIASVPRVVLQLQKLLMPHMGDLWERLIDAGDVDGDDLRSQFAARLRGLLGGRLRRIEWGGGPLARTLHAFFEEQGGIALACGYGGTEIGSVAIQDEIRTFGTAGRPVAANVRIDSGEILVRGPGVTPGYYKNPVATARAQADRGWWRTGDVGRFDEAGNLVVMGRVNAMFNCHEGTNIDPTELEQLLESDAYISQAILIGDRRPYLAALLVVDPERIDTSRAEAVVQERIARINRDLESYEQIRRFAIVDVPFPDAVRQITGARKVRIDRAAVDRTYKETIDRLYADQ